MRHRNSFLYLYPTHISRSYLKFDRFSISYQYSRFLCFVVAGHWLQTWCMLQWLLCKQISSSLILSQHKTHEVYCLIIQHRLTLCGTRPAFIIFTSFCFTPQKPNHFDSQNLFPMWNHIDYLLIVYLELRMKLTKNYFKFGFKYKSSHGSKLLCWFYVNIQKSKNCENRSPVCRHSANLHHAFYVNLMSIYSRPDLFAVKTHETISLWDFQESLSIQNQSWNSSLVITTEKKDVYRKQQQ